MEQPINKQIANMVDKLPEQEQKLVLELVKRLVPDDIATDEDIQAIADANQDRAKKRTTKHEDIDWG